MSASRETIQPGRRISVGECESLHAATAFRSMAAARVIYEDAPHELSSDAKEVRAIAPLHAILIHET